VTPAQQLALWCRRGHPLDDENVYLGHRGERCCRECLRDHLAAVRRWREDQQTSAGEGPAGKENRQPMTKGKYAARAANREARLDNELIAEKVEQIAALEAQVQTLERQLADERRERGVLVIHRADDLSGEQVRAANEKIAELRRAQAERDHEMADQFAEIFAVFMATGGPEVQIPMVQIEHLFVRLVGQEAYGAYEARLREALQVDSKAGTVRGHRRMTLQKRKFVDDASGFNEKHRRKLLLENFEAKSSGEQEAEA
jgi:hypothetical protein